MKRPDRSAHASAALLSALVFVPLLPYLLYVARHGAGPFTLEGDYAGLELAIRFVPSGHTLLGPYSRFGWNHPGPMWFFLAYPFYAIFGGQSTGVFFAACALNGLTASSIVYAMRLYASRVGGAVALAVLLAWLAAFGNTCPLPWNPLTIVLPLVAFIVFAALFARGEAGCAIGVAFFGALAGETHLATIPLVVALTTFATAAFTIVARRRGGLSPRDRRLVIGAVAVLLVALAPAIVEELLTPVGNVTKLVHFFAGRKEPLLAADQALGDWAFGATWLPDRASSAAIADEFSPRPMYSEAVPVAVSAFTVRMTIALVSLVFAAAAVAWKRRDDTGRALVAASVVGTVVAIAALRAVVGPVYYYLVFWTTATTTAASIGAVYTLANGGMAALKERAQAASAVAFVLLAGGSGATFLLERHAVEKGQFISAPEPSLAAIQRALRARVDETGSVPVVHVQGAWNANLSLILELVRDGRDVRVPMRDRWLLGRQLNPPDGLEKPLHVWAAETGKFELAACTEKVISAGRFELFASPHDVERCP